MVPGNILPTPRRVIGNSKGDGAQKANFLKGHSNIMEFPKGFRKYLPWEGMNIFLGKSEVFIIMANKSDLDHFRLRLAHY